MPTAFRFERGLVHAGLRLTSARPPAPREHVVLKLGTDVEIRRDVMNGCGTERLHGQVLAYNVDVRIVDGGAAGRYSLIQSTFCPPLLHMDGNMGHVPDTEETLWCGARHDQELIIKNGSHILLRITRLSDPIEVYTTNGNGFRIVWQDGHFFAKQLPQEEVNVTRLCLAEKGARAAHAIAEVSSTQKRHLVDYCIHQILVIACAWGGKYPTTLQNAVKTFVNLALDSNTALDIRAHLLHRFTRSDRERWWLSTVAGHVRGQEMQGDAATQLLAFCREVEAKLD